MVRGTITGCYSEGGSVLGDRLVGGLVGWNDLSGTISDCYATTNATGNTWTGGLVGRNDGEVSNNCYSAGNVQGGDDVGGLMGRNDGQVTNCSSASSVQGDYDVGGLIGNNQNGEVSYCYSAGSVLGGDNAGGLVGFNAFITISNCYSTASADGDQVIGGLVGFTFGTITNCYSAGSVDGTDGIGGLVGVNGGTVTNSFWDMDSSGQGSSDGGKATSQMQTESTFTNAGWDFAKEAGNGADDYWTICDGQDYPRLKWQFLPPDFDICVEGVDWKDFAYFANFWLDQPCEAANDYCYTADLDGKGSVDANDLAIVSDFWLEGL